MKQENSQYIPLSDINVEEISLLDEKHYQHKIIKDDKIIFQIIDIENNKIKEKSLLKNSIRHMLLPVLWRSYFTCNKIFK